MKDTDKHILGVRIYMLVGIVILHDKYVGCLCPLFVNWLYVWSTFFF